MTSVPEEHLPSDPSAVDASSTETICQYLFWVRRRLAYQVLAEGDDRIGADRCLSTRENRRALQQMMDEVDPDLSSVPSPCRGSMHYPRRGARDDRNDRS